MSTQLCVVAHNIRSLWNVGSLFRTADAMAVEKLWLTGYTATPPRREISKTAIGAEQFVPWEYQQDPKVVIANLKAEGWHIVGLELTESATPIANFACPDKTCLLLGHEVTGIPKEHLTLCDDVVFIPMHGKKESLNVSVATGIALNAFRNN